MAMRQIHTLSEPIIRVSDLIKHFQIAKAAPGPFSLIKSFINPNVSTIKAVDGISFTVQSGEILGYLGPNGAGKSTTIKMLTGLLVPSSGHIFVNNQVPWRDRTTYVARIGAVFGQRTTLWWDLPVIDSFQLLRHMYKIPPNLFQANLAEFRALLDLDDFLHTPVRSLSLGQRMRADICAALFHNPDILFLDEPTIGLDVVAKERIRQFITHINRERNTTVILTTHDLSDIEKLCERVMIIDHGRLLYDGSLETLKNRFSGYRELVVEFAEHYDSYLVQGAVVTDVTGVRVTYKFEREGIRASDLIARISLQYRIQDLLVKEPAIEDTIRRIYEEKLLEEISVPTV